MLLKSLKFKNYGPFYRETTVEFEDSVTVLTGPNDVGKSSLLSLLQRVFQFHAPNNAITDLEVNLDRIGESVRPWEKDQEVGGEAIFSATAHSSSHVSGKWGQLRLHYSLPPQSRAFSVANWQEPESNRWSTGGSINLKSMPTVVRLPKTDLIRPVIDLISPNTTEEVFLRATFGNGYSFENYRQMSDGSFANQLSIARGRANDRLKPFLPSSLAFEFDFQTVGGNRQNLAIQLRDLNAGHSPLTLRGAGVQKLIGIMGSLVASNYQEGHFLVLIDEPETSLHADVQHTLRRILEDIGNLPNAQVVYATHSPSMINAMFPSSLRVLSRCKENDIATSVILPRPAENNFVAVRSSLGITAADSLLFAPVTIIVEGPTEVHGLPIALKRLHESGIPGFENVPLLLNQIHLLDGCGDSFEFLCRLAKSQGTWPIVFVDGDKERRIKAVREKHPDVPVIMLDNRHEFEQIIPCQAYVEALRKSIIDLQVEPSNPFTAESFEEWSASTALPSQMAFTKRIERWLDSRELPSPPKPLVMKVALSDCSPSDIDGAKLKELVSAASELLT